MAGPYYVDLADVGRWDDNAGGIRTGLNSTTNLWRGLSGLQYAFDVVTVGNGPVYIKGTSTGALKSIASTANLVGIFIRGEAVTWDAGASTGVVSEIAANAPTKIEVLTGTLANPDSLTGGYSGATCDVNGAIAAVTIDVDTNKGTYNGGHIKFIGCDSSFTIDGTRAIIDILTAAVAGLTFITNAVFLWFENIEVKNCGGTSNGFSWTTGYNQTGSVFINCCANNNGGAGFYLLDKPVGSYFIRCVAYSNTAHGFYWYCLYWSLYISWVSYRV